MELCDNVFYVYMLVDPFSDLPFYIGKGYNGRSYQHLLPCNYNNGRSYKNNKIRKILKKGSIPKVEIVSEKLSELDALKLEGELIKKFGRKVDGSGILTNILEGGTEQYGKNNPNYGNKWSDEQKEKLSKKKIGKPGHKHTEEHKLYISSIQKKHSFYSIDNDTLEVKKWDSISHFCKTYNITNRTIVITCLKNKRRKILNFYFRELDYSNILDMKLVSEDLFKQEIDYHVAHYRKTVQKDLNGNIIKIWNTRKEPCELYNIAPSSMTYFIKNKKELKGFLWDTL